MQTTEPGPLGGQPKESIQAQPGSATEQPIRPEENPLISITTGHERMQQRITLMLVRLLALVVVITAAMYATTAWTHLRDSDVRDFMNHFAPALLALLGTAIGFYFGDRRQ